MLGESVRSVAATIAGQRHACSREGLILSIAASMLMDVEVQSCSLVDSIDTRGFERR